MNTFELISRARKAGVELYLRDGSLRYRAAIEPPSSLREELKTHKDAIAALLNRAATDFSTVNSLPRHPEGSAPLLPLQQRLYYLEQLAGNKALHNVSLGLAIEGELDIGRFAQAVDALLTRHAILRTNFEHDDGVVRQTPRALKSYDLPLVAVTSKAGETLNDALVRHAGVVLDLEHGLPMQIFIGAERPDRHLVLFVFHHIVFDGSSWEIFRDELASLYRGEDLPDVGASYADYARWRAGPEVCAAESIALAFWKAELDGVAEINDLPPDRTRVKSPSFRSESVQHVLSQKLVTSLRLLAASKKTTLFVLMQAAFSCLLARWTGRTDVVTGTSSVGRTLGDCERMIGFFVNTLPIRLMPLPELGFEQFLRNASDRVAACFSNQDVPFDSIVRTSLKDRDSSTTPLVQVHFSMLEIDDRPLDFGTASAHAITIERDSINFEMECQIVEKAGGVAAVLTYAADLYNRETLTEFAACYETLLSSIVENPATKIGQLKILSAKSQAEIARWNSTDRERPRDQTFLDLFSRTSKAHPEVIAVKSESGELTYRELDELSSRLATQLVARGAGPGKPVGLALTASELVVIGILGILKSGAAYVPLAPDYPPERLQQILRLAAPALILGSHKSPLWLSSHKDHVDIDRLLANEASAVLVTTPLPDDLAYIIFTSGSTGTPKGVMVEHDQLANFLFAAKDVVGLRVGEVIFGVTAPSFDVHVVEVHLALAAGATIVIVARESLHEPSAISALIEEHGVSVIHATPATFSMLIDSGWHPSRGLRLFAGGDTLTLTLGNALLALHPEMRLWNFYGPTEATVYVTVGEVKAGMDRVSIGRGLANCYVDIVDQQGGRLPVGASGELLIGGQSVARGYIGRPDLTAERFVEDTCRPAPARLYRTGDLARWRPDGTVEHLGRLDFQVKLRGHRVELGDVEAALRAEAGVLDAVVVSFGDGSNDAHLVAFVRPSLEGPGAESLRQSLPTHLTSRLPAFMLPSVFIFLDNFPETSNRKIDRKALVALAMHELQTITPPTTELERKLVEIWSSLLARREICVARSFFQQGGHSLLAIKMLRDVETEFALRIPLASFVSAPTILALAQIIDALQDNSAADRSGVETWV